MALRRLETRVNSLIGLSGSFFAARRRICTPWPIDIPSDFATVLNAVRHGLRGVSDANAVGYYRDLADPGQEYGRKVRTIVRGVTALMKHLPLLNPFRYGLFAWQLASHKLCRWLVPFAMVIAMVTNAALAAGSAGYAVLAAAQLLFYAVAFLSLRSVHPLVAALPPDRIPDDGQCLHSRRVGPSGAGPNGCRMDAVGTVS